jgi:hypothetical protein
MYKTQLRTSQLGATGLEITRVGFGAWAIGGGGPPRDLLRGPNPAARLCVCPDDVDDRRSHRPGS